MVKFEGIIMSRARGRNNNALKVETNLFSFNGLNMVNNLNILASNFNLILKTAKFEKL